jgi:polysaccharide export outer membrane protein
MTICNINRRKAAVARSWKVVRERAPIFFLLLGLTALYACSSDGPKRVATGENPAVQHNTVMEYVIGPADVLTISVWNNEDLSQTVTVRPDGKFSFALVGEVEAVGLTPVQLQTRMEEELARFVEVIPGEVSVVVDAVHSYNVSVLGEVRRPGRFEFRTQSTVLDALAMAGGLTEFTSGKDVVVMRRNHGQTEKLHFSYRDMVEARLQDERTFILPGDIIVVH